MLPRPWDPSPSPVRSPTTPSWCSAGRFADHILPDQAHILNVSFLIDRLDRRRGGTAANIAYTLALLGERPLLCAAVGNDFAEYGAALSAVGVDTSPALLCDDVTTATAFITTDLDDNQITAFFPGAMARAAGVNLESLSGSSTWSSPPTRRTGWRCISSRRAACGASLVFAPAQQLSSLSDETLTAGPRRRLAGGGQRLRARGDPPAHGPRRGALLAAAGQPWPAPAAARAASCTSTAPCTGPGCRAEEVVDPTGAGDAYIAGLLTGLRAGRASRGGGADGRPGGDLRHRAAGAAEPRIHARRSSRPVRAGRSAQRARA